MSSPIDRRFVERWERSPEETAEGRASTELELNVAFTDSDSTLAALRMAGNLALDVGARINLLVAHVVPFQFPLTRPPVDVAFTEQRLLDLAYKGAQGPLDTVIHFYLCRDRRQALLQALKPNSLVVIGGRKRWWPTWESKLARMLRGQGHEVIFVVE